MRKGTAALLFLCACAHGARQVPQGPAPNALRLFDLAPAILYRDARERMAKGDWEGAQARLDAYLAKAPATAAVLFDCGFVAEKRGDAAQAADFYARVLQLEPSHLLATLNLSRMKREQPAEAEKLLRAALEAHKDDARLLDALAAVLRAQGRLEDAEALAQKVLSRHPRDVDAYRNLAAIEADRGHVRLSESALQNARRIDGNDAGILNSLGLLAMRRDDVDAARAYFEQATQADASFGPAWANLGAIALSYRDYRAAEEAYAKAAAIDPWRWEIRLAHGWALEGLKKPAQARAEFEKVLALAPGQGDALYGKAVALKAEGDLAGALQAFKEYASGGSREHAREAEGQIASIDLRLRNAAQTPAAARPAPDKRAAGLDLSKLPQSAEPGAPAEKLPAE